jgi:hypothetical protein
VRSTGSSDAEERKEREDDDDEAYEIDDAVHDGFSLSEAMEGQHERMTKVPLALAALRGHAHTIPQLTGGLRSGCASTRRRRRRARSCRTWALAPHAASLVDMGQKYADLSTAAAFLGALARH